MKSNISKFYIIYSILITFVISGCTGLIEKNYNSFEISGFLSTDSSRYAVPSSENIEWAVTAKKDNEEIKATMDGLTFSLTITEGEWDIEAIGKNSDDEIAWYGTTKFTLSSDSEVPAIEIQVRLKDLSAKGSVLLPVSDSTGKADFLTCILKSNSGNTVNITDIKFSEGTANISKTEIEPDTYTGTIFFYDKKSSIIYSCSQIITVYPNLVTDSWDSEVSLSQEDIVAYKKTHITAPLVLWNSRSADGENSFIKGLQVCDEDNTSTQISSPLFTGKSNVWCLDENNNLYAINESDYDNNYITIYKYILRDYGYCSIYEKISTPIIREDASIFAVINLSCTSTGVNTYLYMLYKKDGGDQNASLKVYDISDWDDENPVSVGSANLEDNQNTGWTGESLKWVSANSGTSMIAAKGEDAYIARTNTVSSLTYNLGIESWQLTVESVKLEILPFSIEGNSFTYKGDSSCIDIFIGDYYIETRDNQNNVISTEKNTGLISDLFPNAYRKVQISDMRVIDNYLFVILVHTKEYNTYKSYNAETDNSELGYYESSTGGVVKINLSTKEIESWADGTKILGWYTKEDSVYDCIISNTTTTLKLSAAPPLSQDKKFFYGPRKFIAIKPDELVIADDGYSGTVDDGKEQNRIVNVSLKTWAITSAKNVAVMFDSGITADASGNRSFY